MVYLYFAKVFDKVDHRVLLHKLKKVGICGKLGTWLHHFLIGHKQKVVVDGIHSSGTKVACGVPQGSILGPLLFLVMIEDIYQQIQTARVTSFTDDTRISQAINTKEDPQQF